MQWHHLYIPNPYNLVYISGQSLASKTVKIHFGTMEYIIQYLNDPAYYRCLMPILVVVILSAIKILTLLVM
jgi:hypothetical protein